MQLKTALLRVPQASLQTQTMLLPSSQAALSVHCCQQEAPLLLITQVGLATHIFSVLIVRCMLTGEQNPTLTRDHQQQQNMAVVSTLWFSC